MILTCITPEEYASSFGKPKYVYDSVEFTLHNRQNAQSVILVSGCYDPGHPLMGITLGYDGQMWKCPFSAPFGMPLYSDDLSLGDIHDFFTELTHLIGAPLSITLPAALHTDNMWAKIAGTLNNLADRRIDDFNFSYPLPLNPEQIISRMTGAAKRNIRRSLKSGLKLVKTDDAAAVYDIIAAHHQAKGYRMTMKRQGVIDTAQIVPTDFYLLTLDDAEIAAVYIQHVGDSTAQLINWGDLPGNHLVRPMNFMAYELALRYAGLGFKHFDLGPASTAGIPNAGLCRFKQEIGCDITLKPTFRL